MERMDMAERGADDTDKRECCCPRVSESVRRVVTVVCCFILACTGGFTYTFGNINPYVTSYLRNRTRSDDTDYMDTLWLPQTTSITTNAVMPLVGLLSSLLHLKLYIGLGVFLFAVSLFSTYWTMQQSFPLVVLTYGFIFGVGHAFVYPTAVNVAMAWAPQRKALVCGAVLMGYGVGPTAWNQLTTWFINRNNIQPDLHMDKDVYFTQAEVLDKVPDCFLLMGTVLAGVQVVCLGVMCVPPTPPPTVVCLGVMCVPPQPPPTARVVDTISPGELHNPVDSSAIKSETSCNGGQKSLNTGYSKTKQEEISPSEKKTQEVVTSQETNQEVVSFSEKNIQGAINSETSINGEQKSPITASLGTKQEVVSSSEKKQEVVSSSGKKTPEAVSTRQYRPKEVLKSRPFWTLWVMNVGVTVGTATVLSLYKAYGQTFINDDHFLSVVASVSSVFNAVGRPLWGALGDRFGCRMVDLIAQSMLACLVATFVTCETAGRWAFMFWSAAMFFTISGVFTLTPPLIFALYGSKHFRVNVGLMDMSGVVGAVLTVVVVPILKDAFGWHGMFYVGFAGLFASMLLNMSMSLKIGDSIPDHMRPILSL